MKLPGVSEQEHSHQYEQWFKCRPAPGWALGVARAGALRYRLLQQHWRREVQSQQAGGWLLTEPPCLPVSSVNTGVGELLAPEAPSHPN